MHRILFALVFALLLFAPPTFAQEAPTPPAPGVAHSTAPRAASFTLRTGIAQGRMVFIGSGGDIDGQVNPTLMVHEGETVQITLINGEGAEHDIVLDDFAARSNLVVSRGASSTLAFSADKVGEFFYYCSVAGHRAAGMEGRIQVMPGGRSEMEAMAPEIIRDPADLPGPLEPGPPRVVKVDLSTPELVGALDTKSSYQYWTFNGRVPGPFVRVRVGDMVEVRLTNPEDSLMIHSVDFHGATGPGGGAEFTQTDPGDTRTVSFRALIPGIYVYHCATPSVANHIANGMYGLLLVEPEGGLPRVDREFYVMQGEIYTVAPYGNTGPQEFDYEKMMAEDPEYFVFNGAVEALAHRHPLRARVGEKVRIYFGVGGPNFTSSFHVIGEIFDAVYQGGSLTSPPITGVQTVSVPPGGAIAVDFKIDRAGRYILVDHALSRAERGLLGFLIVEGPENDAIMHQGPVE
jgi:nitrite reductase (NO-forming)